MDDVIGAMAQKIRESFDRQVFGAFTEPAQDDGRDILADLEQASFLLSRPVPVAIWFIDRPHEYHRVLAQTAAAETEHEGPWFTVHNGMPLYQWTLAEIEAGIREMTADGCDPYTVAERFPFQLPGVWVQMRNAPHVRLIEQAAVTE